jgi:hypothetical protein
MYRRIYVCISIYIYVCMYVLFIWNNIIIDPNTRQSDREWAVEKLSIWHLSSWGKGKRVFQMMWVWVANLSFWVITM